MHSSPQSQPHTFGRWIYVVGIALLCVVVLAGSFPGKDRWIRVLHDSGHGYVFAIVGVLCLLAWRRLRHSPATGVGSYAAAAVAAAVIGLLTEVAQRFTSRDASWADVGMDAVGAVFGLSLLFAYERHRESRPGVWPAIALAMVAAVVMLKSTAVMAYAYYQRDQAFPTIARFDQYYGRYFTNGENVETVVLPLSNEWSKADEQALVVAYQPSDWAIIVFADVVPDWTGYSTLVIDLVNPQDEPLRIGFRGNDEAHDFSSEPRYAERFQLPPRTRQQLRIPLEKIKAGPKTRQSDLSRMDQFGLFKSPAKKEERVYVVGIWLE